MENRHCSELHAKVSCAVITVSDTRNKETDKSGRLIIDLLRSAGHSVKMYKIISDDQPMIQRTIREATHHRDIEAIMITGGTGIAKRDVTIESIQPLFDKELPGFGELFRMLSFQFDIGSAAILSRAVAGIANQRIIFSMPGSTGAVKLAMEMLILPELAHLFQEATKDI